MSLEELAKKARDLSNALFNNTGDMKCARTEHGRPSCMQQEELRALTRDEIAKGWSRRPFSAYREENICNACLAYWHAERCAQTLDNMHCLQQKYGTRK